MAGSRYFVERGGLRSGPFSSYELKGLAASGEIWFNDRIWKEGIHEAIPAYKVHGLFPSAVHDVFEDVLVDQDPNPIAESQCDQKGQVPGSRGPSDS